ncbi:AraC family transcriptional regulator [Bradyrhizobium liaoningense]|uniref:AraC family transcriptional regulator n=1 Tax=Bradyrhizobium liaoningense TaxID=43992 RepID=UPI001BA70C93|nr:AraC family transcriptional regulator [Bradyrhizobium liaoningense]
MQGADDNAADQSPLPHFILDTQGTPHKQALAIWHEQVGLLGQTRLKNPERFHARVEYYQLGALVLGTAKTQAQSFDRSRYQIGRDGVSHYVLQFYVDGGCRPRFGAQTASSASGDFMTFDCAQPQMTETPDYASIHLFVPRPLLAPLLSAPDEQNMRIFAGGGALVGMFRDHLMALWRRAPLLTVREGEALAKPTLELAATVINGSVREDAAGGVQLALFDMICRHVIDHALNPELTPESIAAHFAISPRKLSYLFENAGGIASYIQEQRMHRARMALADSAQRHKSISDIAEAHGFVHPQSFTRAFQRLHGLTPREFRALARDQRSWDPQLITRQMWWKWMTSIPS